MDGRLSMVKRTLLWTLGIGAILGLSGACRNPAQFKQEADKEVYEIISSKWQDDFGQQVNYEVSEQAPNDVDVDRMIPASGMINLAQAVNIATQFSRNYQSQKESLYSAGISLSNMRHRYKRQWFSTFDATYEDNNGSEGMSVSGGETPGKGPIVGVDQDHLIGDGIQIGTGLAIDWIRFLSGDPHTTLTSVLTASVTAPLLGAGAGKQAREDLTQRERNMLYQIRTFNRFRKEFVISIINSYYQVLQQRDTVTVREDSYTRQVDNTNRLTLQYEVGQLAKPAADEAQQALLRAENSLISARQSYQRALDNFKITLALPTDANVVLDQNELPALEAAGVYEPTYTEDEAIEIALERRLDLANTRDGLDDAERDLILKAEGLGTQLNLVGGAGVSSSDADMDYTRLRFHEGNYSLGVEGNLPLDRKTERNNYRQALISVQQRQRGYDEEIDRVKLDMRQALRDLLETAESYRIQKIGVKLAADRVQEQKIRLQYGSGVIRELQISEASLVDAQINVTDALINHTIAKLNFFRDLGLLQVRPDGMWEQVNYDISERQANAKSIEFSQLQ